MNADELIALNEQIAGMASAGLPLDQGLACLAREMSHGRLRRVTASIASDLQAGSTLPESLSRRQKELPPYYANLVTAGIRTGRLPEVLATLTAYARTVSATRAIVVDALFYPVVVLLFTFALLIVMVFFILPQFEQIFNDFQMQLPAITKVVLALGRNPIPMVLLPAAVVVGGLFLLWGALRMTERGRRVWASLIYSIPVIGSLMRSARLAAFADLLAALIEHELPLPEAFQLAGAASSDPIMAHQALEICDHLNHGDDITDALRGRGLLPEWVAWMTGAGQKRGALGSTLRQIGALYRRQVEARAALLRTVFPAFMIIFTAGVLVGVFVMSIMLPLIKLLEGLSK